jgi:methyl-accepting chemotaxis protein
MKSLRNLSINSRLIAGFVAVLVLMGSAALVGLWQLGKLERIADRLANEETQKLALAERWMRGIAVNLVRAKVSLVATDEEELIAQFRTGDGSHLEEITEHEKAIEALVTRREGRKLLERIGADREKYRTLRAGLLKRRAAGEDVRPSVSKDMSPAADTYYRGVREFVEWQQGAARVGEEGRRRVASTGRALVIVALAIGLALGLAIAFLISRSVVGPLMLAREHALRIAQGDLQAEIAAEGRDEGGADAEGRGATCSRA